MLGLKISDAQKQRYYNAAYWTEETLLTRWEKSVAAFGDREFIADDLGGRYTYSQMDELSDRVAAALRSLSLTAGEVVTYQITPRSEFAAVTLACFKLGAVAVPLGMCFEGVELRSLLEMLDSRVHLSVPTYKGEARAPMLRQSLTGLLLLRNIVVVAEKPEESFPTLSSIMREALPRDLRYRGSGDELAVMLCTSGTTQGCKAVMYTHNNIIFSEDGFNKAFNLTEHSCIFMPAPLNHATGFHHGLISPMLRGGRIVLQERFHCARAVEIMNRERCTYSMGATPFIYDLVASLDETGKKLPHLRFYICGGAPVPGELIERAYSRHGILVAECYGSTESVPHLFVHPDEVLQVCGRWSGRAMEGVEVRIVDENHCTLPPNTMGEEASRGPNVFSGYWKNAPLTNAVLDDEGWYYSGDLCTMDEQGNVRVVGRKKDIIIRGGENLNTNRLNEYIEGCPGVIDHAVIGMPDPRLGERICAFIVCRENAPPVTLKELVEYMKEKNVPKRYWPERLEQIDTIERTDSGKVKKHVLSEELRRRMDAEREER